MKRVVVLFSIVMMLFLSSGLAAANTSSHYEPPAPMNFIWTAVIIVAATCLFIVVPFGKRFAQRYKQFFFLLIAIPVVLSSFYLGVHTIYENSVSVTKGPVHWHADYEVWVCGEEIDLIDPKGLNNKIGTPVLHEHNDHRIHVEGTVLRYEDVHLGTYFDVIGGKLTSTELMYQTNEELVHVANGDVCPDGSVGTLGVFVNGERISDPGAYLLAPEIFVPNGDCIIIDFSADDSTTTDKICASWEAEGISYRAFNEGERVSR